MLRTPCYGCAADPGIDRSSHFSGKIPPALYGGGSGHNLLGISYMVHLILRERRKVMPLLFDAILAKES